MDDIRIIIADDHLLIRKGLHSLIDSQPDMQVVAEVPDGFSAIEQVSALAPQVVIMDVAMPGMSGVEATQRILAIAPQTKVIALSAHTDERTAQMMFRAGVVGFVVKQAAFEELAVAIHKVLQGGTYRSPNVCSESIASQARSDLDSPATTFDRLSPRERDVLQLIAEGKSTKEVARAIGVSIKTVETHRRNLMEKLKLDSIAELTKCAVREGLSPLGS